MGRADARLGGVGRPAGRGGRATCRPEKTVVRPKLLLLMDNSRIETVSFKGGKGGKIIIRGKRGIVRPTIPAGAIQNPEWTSYSGGFRPCFSPNTHGFGVKIAGH